MEQAGQQKKCCDGVAHVSSLQQSSIQHHKGMGNSMTQCTSRPSADRLMLSPRITNCSENHVQVFACPAA